MRYWTAISLFCFRRETFCYHLRALLLLLLLLLRENGKLG
jgi:hypothetical protein